MPNQFWAVVTEHKELVADFWLLTIKNEELARASKPGQFLHIKVSPGLTPLLRRPISIHDVEKDEIKILYHVLGEGTRLLTKYQVGESIDVMGPLGNGFELEGGSKVAVVAGGIGVAPLMYLVKALVSAGKEVTLYQGAREEQYLLGQKEFETMSLTYKVATDDGSFGVKGFVTELLEQDLKEASYDTVYACGPHLMLSGVAKITEKYKVASQVSLEERMGCGTGACLACVCKIKVRENNDFTYKKVCVDGPVFKGGEVDFND